MEGKSFSQVGGRTSGGKQWTLSGSTFGRCHKLPRIRSLWKLEGRFTTRFWFILPHLLWHAVFSCSSRNPSGVFLTSYIGSLACVKAIGFSFCWLTISYRWLIALLKVGSGKVKSPLK
jgi:hypothetical protein